MSDRVTRGIALISVNQIISVNEIWGVDYPVCGDTLAKERKERHTNVSLAFNVPSRVKPLSDRDKRLIRAMNQQRANPELNWEQ